MKGIEKRNVLQIPVIICARCSQIMLNKNVPKFPKSALLGRLEEVFFFSFTVRELPKITVQLL